MHLDDTQIMQRVQSGQLELFDELVRRYRGALQRVAMGKLGDTGRAEDLVQETFLAVFASRHTYKSEFSFRTWLWTILLNLCRRELSKTAKRPREFARSAYAPSESTLSPPEPASTETGLTKVLKGERNERLAAFLETLTDVQADAIRLRFFGGLKYSEIAQAMGSSEITAKVRVRNGLTRLARKLRAESGDSP